MHRRWSRHRACSRDDQLASVPIGYLCRTLERMTPALPSALTHHLCRRRLTQAMAGLALSPPISRGMNDNAYTTGKREQQAAGQQVDTCHLGDDHCLRRRHAS